MRKLTKKTRVNRKPRGGDSFKSKEYSNQRINYYMGFIKNLNNHTNKVYNKVVENSKNTDFLLKNKEEVESTRVYVLKQIKKIKAEVGADLDNNVIISITNLETIHDKTKYIMDKFKYLSDIYEKITLPKQSVRHQMSAKQRYNSI